MLKTFKGLKQTMASLFDIDFPDEESDPDTKELIQGFDD